MKTNERISFLSNVLIVACTRLSNSDVGRLVKALVEYATDGTRPTMDDIRLETYFDLIAQDIDSLRTAAEIKSRKCSESAKCRTAKSTARPVTASKRLNDSNSPQEANERGSSTHADPASEGKNATAVYDANAAYRNISHRPSGASDFIASDPTSSFQRIKLAYNKTGDNESQAFEAWKRLTADERNAAFAHAQRLQGNPAPRSYLFVYLRDKEWLRTGTPQGGQH